jgi:phosphonate transport system substrate-binding protein
MQLVSYLAPNLFWFYEAVSAYLSRTLQIETHLKQSEYDPLDDPELLDDRVDLAFICGLPFMRHHQVKPQQLRAIVAPVMQAPRYQNQPVYCADIIISATSSFTTIADLAGTTFCYNDPGSNSGYNLLRHYLKHHQYRSRFFKAVIQSGSHQTSMRWVADHKADCAAIDSTVLEEELRNFPQLNAQLRVIGSTEFCPMPPIVVAQRLGNQVIDHIQSALLQPDRELQSAMSRAKILRFATVETEDYSPIADMYLAAIHAGYDTLA